MSLPPVARPVLALLLAAAAARADEPAVWDGRTSAKEVTAAIKEYFDAGVERRFEIREFLDGLGTLRPADVRKHARAILKESKRHGRKIKRKSGQVFTHGELSAPFYVAGRPKRRWPLLIALHGGGKGVGDGRNAIQKWSIAASKAFVIAPTAPELRDSAWCHEDIEQWVLALIEAAKRSFDIDTNRIYIAGHSMGGYGAWSIGCRHADRFAALASGAGGVFVSRGRQDSFELAPGHIPNLLHTPIYFFHSTDDKQVNVFSDRRADEYLKKLKEKGYPFEWVYEEYENIGHGLPPKGLKPIVDWLVKRKRDPHPRQLLWEPSRPFKRRFCWIESDVRGRIEAKIEGNDVTISSGTSDAVTVYLCKQLLDVDNPVKITRNGEELFSGRVYPRLSVLLEFIATSRDANRWYAYAVTLP